MDNQTTIDRDVGEQSKGPRLQRLRAAELILEALERSDHAHAYCAVEHQGDVYVKEATSAKTEEYHEEDKNYDEDTSFTFASEAVLNTLVIFVDCWLARQMSGDVLFGFYSPNGCGKEKKSDRTKNLGVNWPDESILQQLQANKLDDSAVITCVKLMILDEYGAQYPAKPTAVGRGNLATIEKWSDDQWRAFFRQVRWKFGSSDHNELEKTLVEKIKKSKYYDQSLAGKERYILAAICDLLDKRQTVQDPLERLIHAAEVALIFRDISAGERRIPDPSWKMWQQLPGPTDTRNLRDKVEAVTKAASNTQIGRWSRRASNSHVSQTELQADHTILSFKYQVYDVCEEYLDGLRKASPCRPWTPDEIERCVDDLAQRCRERMADRSRDFSYSVSSSSFLMDMIWELFDSCYLSFDAGAS